MRKSSERAILYSQANDELDRFPTREEMREFSRAVDEYFERRYKNTTDFNWGYQKITKRKSEDGGKTENKGESEGKGEGESESET